MPPPATGDQQSYRQRPKGADYSKRGIETSGGIVNEKINEAPQVVECENRKRQMNRLNKNDR